jgi:hypothetical protein
VNVQDYVTDLTAAPTTIASQINQAITDAVTQGRSLNGFAGKLFPIGSSLVIPTGAHIDWEEAEIKRVGAVFDMIVNADIVNGNSDIIMRRLRKINGDYATDGLARAVTADRFAGLRFMNVSDSGIEWIGVTGTCSAEIQPEGNRAGIVLDTCSGVDVDRVTSFGNDGSGLFFYACTKCNTSHGLSTNDGGSGFTSYISPDCATYRWSAYGSGTGGTNPGSGATFSGVSCNGTRYRGYKLRGEGCTGTGVNIGHAGQDTSDSQFDGIFARNNQLDGLTIGGAQVRVQADSIHVEGNGSNGTRHGIRVYNGVGEVHLSNIVSRANVGDGIALESGTKHTITDGISEANGVSGVWTSADVHIRHFRARNNGAITSTDSAGVVLSNTSAPCRLDDVRCYDDQGTPTQESALWIGGPAGGHRFGNGCYFPINKTYGVRRTGSPALSSFGATPALAAQLNDPGAREPYPRAMAGTSITPGSGVLLLTAIPVLAGDVISHISLITSTTALTMGTNLDGHLWAALYDSGGNLISQSADQGGSATMAASTRKTFDLPSSYSVPADGFVYAAFMVNVGTGGTPVVPTLRGASTGGSAVAAPGLTNFATLAATNGTGLGATAPAGPLTLTATSGIAYMVTTS